MVSMHVVSGGGAETTLRTALASVAPMDAVVGLRDPLNVGPLWDIDAAGAARWAFWDEIHSPAHHTIDGGGDAAAWAALRSARCPIVIWHGPHPAEYLLSLRVAARLAGDGATLHEVVRPPSTRRLPAFFDAVGLANVDELTALVGARVPILDVPARAARWQALCKSTTSFFRDLTPHGIVELGADAYDDRIAAACTRTWRTSPRVVGEILAELPVGDLVLAWRLRALVTRGVLEGRGHNPFGVAEVRLAS